MRSARYATAEARTGTGACPYGCNIFRALYGRNILRPYRHQSAGIGNLCRLITDHLKRRRWTDGF